MWRTRHYLVCCVVLLSLIVASSSNGENGEIEERESMQEQHFLAAGVRERQKRAGLGLLERLKNKEVPETCEDELCPRGMELHRRCNDTVDMKTLCVPCRYKFFKDEKSFAACRPCSVCAPGQTVSRWCTTKRNTLCSGEYIAPPPQVIKSKVVKKEKPLIPAYWWTIVTPCTLLLAILLTSLIIYIRIKTGKGKYPDKAPLTQNEDVDCCYDDAGPLPPKVAILDPKALPSSVNIDSPVPGGSRIIDANADKSYEFSFQVHPSSIEVDTMAVLEPWRKNPATWRKFCSTPNIPDACDPRMDDGDNGDSGEQVVRSKRD